MPFTTSLGISHNNQADPDPKTGIGENWKKKKERNKNRTLKRLNTFSELKELTGLSEEIKMFAHSLSTS